MTSTPAMRRRSAPPAAFGLGSRMPMTTRFTPARMRASEQGPVRPVWLQGSSVTAMVHPFGAMPFAWASLRHMISAWGWPALW